MDHSWLNESLQSFSAHLAAKEPVPGGGGAAALIGALAAAMAAMAGNYTVGKKAYAAHEAEIQSAVEQAEALRMQLLALIDADAEAFLPLAAAYAMPKDDPMYAETLHEATANAALAPIGMVQCCALLAPVLSTLQRYGSRLMQSDVGCAAHAAIAALRCAYLNVLVNLRSLPEGAALQQQVRPMLDAALEQLHAVAEAVEADLGS